MNKIEIVMLAGAKTIMYYAFMVPVCLVLSPLCIISSGLLKYFFDIFESEYDWLMAGILTLELLLSMCSLVVLVKRRAFRSILYFQYALFILLANSTNIGIVYSLFDRQEIYEQLLIKVLSSLLLLVISDALSKLITKLPEGDCSICYQKLNEQTITLRCRHHFHEGCLWRWVLQRRCCPYCKQQC